METINTIQKMTFKSSLTHYSIELEILDEKKGTKVSDSSNFDIFSDDVKILGKEMEIPL